MPALVFAIGLAACWVVDGFRRRKPPNLGETVGDLGAFQGALSGMQSNRGGDSELDTG